MNTSKIANRLSAIPGIGTVIGVSTILFNLVKIIIDFIRIHFLQRKINREKTNFEVLSELHKEHLIKINKEKTDSEDLTALPREGLTALYNSEDLLSALHQELNDLKTMRQRHLSFITIGIIRSIPFVSCTLWNINPQVSLRRKKYIVL